MERCYSVGNTLNLFTIFLCIYKIIVIYVERCKFES